MSSLRRNNPKQLYRKFKTHKKDIHHNITLEQFEEHFKKLTSNSDLHPQDLPGENTQILCSMSLILHLWKKNLMMVLRS